MPQKSSGLTTKLPELRRKVRMSQRDLADSTRELGVAEAVSVATIQAIESGATTPKASTLRKIANGLARDSFTGQIHEARADAINQELMVAAGYMAAAPSSESSESIDPRRPVEDLTDEEVVQALETRLDDRALAVRFLSVASHWRQMSPSAQRAVLNSLDLAEQFDQDLKRAEDRHRKRRPRS